MVLVTGIVVLWLLVSYLVCLGRSAQRAEIDAALGVAEPVVRRLEAVGKPPRQRSN